MYRVDNFHEIKKWNLSTIDMLKRFNSQFYSREPNDVL